MLPQLMTLSPDGEWLWNGEEWIPAPPNHSPNHHNSVHSSDIYYGDSEWKMKSVKYRKPKPLIAIIVAALIIISTATVGGYLLLSELEEKKIEGIWQFEEGSSVDFQSTNLFFVYDDEGIAITSPGAINSWTVDNGLLSLKLDEGTASSTTVYQYNVNGDYLYLRAISSVAFENGVEIDSLEYDDDEHCYECIIMWRPKIQPSLATINANAPSWFTYNSLSSDRPEAGSLNNFAAEDASAFLSGATDDTMIRMSWTYADENLNWAFLSFKLEKGDSVYTCEIASNADGADCLIEQTGDSATQWESDEIVYIKENGADLCTSSCDLTITIQYNGQVLSGTNSVTIA